MAPLILAAVAVASSGYQINRSMAAERQQERATRDQRADNQRREDQLTNEAKAKAAATEKMKTAGQRAGMNYGFSSGSGFGTMFRSAPARPTEDNIGRGSLFGN